MNAQTPIDRSKADRPIPKPGILAITPYVPGKSKIDGVEHPVKLSSNENILGCSPAAREAFLAAGSALGLYPDGRGNALRDAVATRYRLEPERLILGCGTDEIFALLNQTYLQAGDNIVQGEFGFGAYAIGARANQAEVRFAAETRYRIDVDAVLGQVDERTRLVFIANPANPTGTFISLGEVERLHAALPENVILVLDGAYAEFNTDPTFGDGLDLARGAGNVSHNGPGAARATQARPTSARTRAPTRLTGCKRDAGWCWRRSVPLSGWCTSWPWGQTANCSRRDPCR